MKPKLRFVTAFRQRRDGGFLNFLFRPPGLLIIFLLLFSAIASAQEQTPPPGEFTVGSPLKQKLREQPQLLAPFEEAGFNTIWNRADDYTKNVLVNFDLLAENVESDTEYIYHFTTAYYSKWEAEQNQTNSARVGVKHYDSQGHTFGQVVYWDSAWCWSTKGLSAPACSLMYGPHYRQDTRYKRWVYDWQNYRNVMYVPRFRMALDNHGGANSTEDVCIIKVIYRYKEVYSPAPNDYEFFDSVFLQRTLKVSDFDTNGKLTHFNFTFPHDWYKYPEDFILPAKLANIVNSPDYMYRTDSESYTGIQFCVDWLREDTLCTLYIDYAEVYDNNGWNRFIDFPNQIAQQIKDYALSFPNSQWPNLIYWSGVDEPYSIDCYTPIRVVDSLIRSVQAPPMVVHFDPYWTWDLKINGEDEIEMFYNIAVPNILETIYYPIELNFVSSFGLESLKRRIYYKMK